MACGGLLRASPGQRLRRLGQELLPYRNGTQMGACGHRRGVDAQSQVANARRERRAIAIATALDKYRGGRRGFLPRGLCNTCPTAVRALDRLCGWAGVTQALTGPVAPLIGPTNMLEDVAQEVTPEPLGRRPDWLCRPACAAPASSSTPDSPRACLSHPSE